MALTMKNLRGSIALWLLIAGIAALETGCQMESNNTPTALYQVQRLETPMAIDGNWDKPQWQNAPSLSLGHFMGQKPEHMPKVNAKVLYDDQNVYVIFRVEDRYVRAVAHKHNAAVYEDSCVEFFFTPGTDLGLGYFNLEMNCGGTMLFYHQTARGQNATAIKDADRDTVEVAHTMPKIVATEITEPTTWIIEYRIPVKILENYCNTVKPGPGVTWRANFYKCADKTSHPHWLTWAKINRRQPDFHLPEFFGTLQFK